MKACLERPAMLPVLDVFSGLFAGDASGGPRRGDRGYDRGASCRDRSQQCASFVYDALPTRSLVQDAVQDAVQKCSAGYTQAGSVHPDRRKVQSNNSRALFHPTNRTDRSVDHPSPEWPLRARHRFGAHVINCHQLSSTARAAAIAAGGTTVAGCAHTFQDGAHIATAV